MAFACAVWVSAVACLVGATAASAAAPAPKGKDLRGKFLEKRDLRNENLEYAILDDAKMFLVNFKDGRGKGASFKDADLTSATLDGADLEGADFRGATLSSAGVQGTNLKKANLSGLDLSDVSLQRSDLREADLRKVKGIGDVTRADFRKADLRGANLLGMKDYAGTTANFRGAKYDADTRWPKNFDVEASGAELTASDPVVAKAEPKADPRPVAKAEPLPEPPPQPKADPAPVEPAETKVPAGGPPVTDIKAQLEKVMWGPPMQGGVKHTYEYKSLRVAEPRLGNYVTDGTPANKPTMVYPVKVNVVITRTFRDGTSKTEEKKQQYVFYKDEFGDWTFRFKGND